ncbi:MAG: 3-deoxy-7-phosphoheptulonate synthase, partial [Chloroflexi bacterium]|nr:3-deoxy-7-phosphoheptulonate synthase [Chloroflexota bacterium]
MAQSVRDVNITKIEPLIAPEALQRRVPLTPSAAETIVEGRKAVERILAGDDPRMLVIVGPCSIHDEKAALEYADRLGALAERLADRILIVMRVYFE